MEENTFEEIIKPLNLLEKTQREFILSAIRGNFKQYKNNNPKLSKASENIKKEIYYDLWRKWCNLTETEFDNYLFQKTQQ